MIAIIPALLRSEDDLQALVATLAHLPPEIVDKCVIVSQGMPVEAQHLPFEREYTVLHRDTPLTKWGAITRARDSLRGRDEQTLLIDADDPFEAASIREFCVRGAQPAVECLMGSRDQVDLVAEDARSPSTRLFIEIFTNTLLLGRLGRVPRVAPDIQCGLYVLSAKVFATADFSFLNTYGGELTLYHHLARSGARVEEQPVRSNRSLRSAYRSDEILRETLSLPFLANPTKQEIQRALDEGPRLYGRWMSGRSPDDYRQEMLALLS